MGIMPLPTKPVLITLKANVVAAKPPSASGAGSAIALIAEMPAMSCLPSTLSAAAGAATLSCNVISAMPLPPLLSPCLPHRMTRHVSLRRRPLVFDGRDVARFPLERHRLETAAPGLPRPRLGQRSGE